jgi:hypothetical protein
MELVTPKEAAKRIFGSVGMIAYWVKKGRVQRHYVLNNKRNYLVDLEEAKKARDWKETLRETLPKNLISRKEAADLLWITETEIGYYARMGYIKRYHVFGNDYHYLVDRDEVLAQPKLIDVRVEARNPRLREHALSQKRGERGWFLPS